MPAAILVVGMLLTLLSYPEPCTGNPSQMECGKDYRSTTQMSQPSAEYTGSNPPSITVTGGPAQYEISVSNVAATGATGAMVWVTSGSITSQNWQSLSCDGSFNRANLGDGVNPIADTHTFTWASESESQLTCEKGFDPNNCPAGQLYNSARVCESECSADRCCEETTGTLVNPLPCSQGWSSLGCDSTQVLDPSNICSPDGCTASACCIDFELAAPVSCRAEFGSTNQNLCPRGLNFDPAATCPPTGCTASHCCVTQFDGTCTDFWPTPCDAESQGWYVPGADCNGKECTPQDCCLSCAQNFSAAACPLGTAPRSQAACHPWEGCTNQSCCQPVVACALNFNGANCRPDHKVNNSAVCGPEGASCTEELCCVPKSCAEDARAEGCPADTLYDPEGTWPHCCLNVTNYCSLDFPEQTSALCDFGFEFDGNLSCAGPCTPERCCTAVPTCLEDFPNGCSSDQGLVNATCPAGFCSAEVCCRSLSCETDFRWQDCPQELVWSPSSEWGSCCQAPDTTCGESFSPNGCPPHTHQFVPTAGCHGACLEELCCSRYRTCGEIPSLVCADGWQVNDTAVVTCVNNSSCWDHCCVDDSNSTCENDFRWQDCPQELVWSPSSEWGSCCQEPDTTCGESFSPNGCPPHTHQFVPTAGCHGACLEELCCSRYRTCEEIPSLVCAVGWQVNNTAVVTCVDNPSCWDHCCVEDSNSLLSASISVSPSHSPAASQASASPSPSISPSTSENSPGTDPCRGASDCESCAEQNLAAVTEQCMVDTGQIQCVWCAGASASNGVCRTAVGETNRSGATREVDGSDPAALAALEEEYQGSCVGGQAASVFCFRGGARGAVLEDCSTVSSAPPRSAQGLHMCWSASLLVCSLVLHLL